MTRVVEGMSEMRTANPDVIVWIDTETTGLDAETNHLLEVAIVVTRNDLREVGHRTVLVEPSCGVDAAVAAMNDFVRDMHTGNALIGDLRAGHGLPTRDAETDLREWLHATAGEGPFLIAGNSLTLDRNFLDRYMPVLFSMLHYRSIDVSSLAEDMRRDGYAERITRMRNTATPTDPHRALGDLRDSIRQLEALRAMRTAPENDSAGEVEPVVA